MAPLFSLLAAWGITVAIAGLAARAIWHPLYTLLSELCGAEQRARFWSVWSMVMLILTPTLLVSMVDVNADIARLAKDTMVFTLSGIALALIGMGCAVWSRTQELGTFPKPDAWQAQA